jgi:heme/copper-type cytochrome/quinol oxidase subunit 2
MCFCKGAYFMSKKMKEISAIVITLLVSVIALYFTWVYRNLEITHKIWNIITYVWIAFMVIINMIGIVSIFNIYKKKKELDKSES